jgi:hypothetical protein
MNEPKSGEQNIPSVTEPSGGEATHDVKPSAILSQLHSELVIYASWLEPQAKSERINRLFLMTRMALEDLTLEFRSLEQGGWRAKSGLSWRPTKPESDQGLP